MTWPSVDSRAALQHGGDLDRMVAVIVDDGDAVPFAGAGEAALDAAEAGERLADRVVGDAELARDRDRRRGVQHVVAARHRQRQLVDRVHVCAVAVAEHDVEARLAAGDDRDRRGARRPAG